MGFIDRISGALGIVATWLFVATGAMITWEVVARYFFNAPTIWAAELSQALLIWGTFLGASLLLREGRHISITVVTGKFGHAGRMLCDTLSLVAVMLFSAWIAWQGLALSRHSFEMGRSSGSMMNLPNWLLEAAVPVGFSVLTMQAVVCLIRLVLNRSTADVKSVKH